MTVRTLLSYKHICKGFTFLELVLVIVVAAILLAVSSAGFYRIQTIDLQASAENLRSDIRYAQMLAIIRHETVRLNFSSNSYNIMKGDNSRSNYLYFLDNAYTTTPHVMTLANNTSLAWSGLPNNYLAFNFQGVPYITVSLTGASETALAASATLTLTRGSNSKSLTIAPETGSVSIT